MKKILYLGLIFYLPFAYSHEVKQLDITDRCYIEQDQDGLGDGVWWNFYAIKAFLTTQEMIDYINAPAEGNASGRLELKVTLNVDGKEKIEVGALDGWVVKDRSTVFGLPYYRINNRPINESENVSIKNCTILIN